MLVTHFYITYAPYKCTSCTTPQTTQLSLSRLIERTHSAPIHLPNSTGIFGHRAILVWGDRDITGVFSEKQTNILTLLPKSLEIGFHSIIRDLRASIPRIWYASLFVKPRSRYQKFRAILKISYKVGNWVSSPPLRREAAVVGPSSHAAAKT